MQGEGQSKAAQAVEQCRQERFLALRKCENTTKTKDIFIGKMRTSPGKEVEARQQRKGGVLRQ